MSICMDSPWLISNVVLGAARVLSLQAPYIFDFGKKIVLSQVKTKNLPSTWWFIILLLVIIAFSWPLFYSHGSCQTKFTSFLQWKQLRIHAPAWCYAWCVMCVLFIIVTHAVYTAHILLFRKMGAFGISTVSQAEMERGSEPPSALYQQILSYTIQQWGSFQHLFWCTK